MNMDEYFVLFREYMLVQKPSSVNTRDSYLRDVSAFLRYLEGENITSPLEVETETVEAYVQHLHSLNRTGWSAVRRHAVPAIRCSAALSVVVWLRVPLAFPSKYDAGFLFGLIAADKPILSI